MRLARECNSAITHPKRYGNTEGRQRFSPAKKLSCGIDNMRFWQCERCRKTRDNLHTLVALCTPTLVYYLPALTTTNGRICLWM